MLYSETSIRYLPSFVWHKAIFIGKQTRRNVTTYYSLSHSEASKEGILKEGKMEKFWNRDMREEDTEENKLNTNKKGWAMVRRKVLNGKETRSISEKSWLARHRQYGAVFIFMGLRCKERILELKGRFSLITHCQIIEFITPTCTICIHSVCLHET